MLERYDVFGKTVTAFSTTRHGGCGTGAYGSFNINRFCGDSNENISENRRRLCRLLGIGDDRLLMPHQVHGTKTVAVDEQLLGLAASERTAALDGFDAIMTDVRGVCIGVSTADCIPVLLYDTAKKAVCAVHAGWRGTVRRIVEKALAEMSMVYGTSASDIVAQIGPGISLDSFEVGDEVYEIFAGENFNMEHVSRRNEASGKWHINLPECNRRQLLQVGVCEENIEVSDVCTFKQCDRFFSARRLGVNSGRIFTGIMLNG